MKLLLFIWTKAFLTVMLAALGIAEGGNCVKRGYKYFTNLKQVTVNWYTNILCLHNSNVFNVKGNVGKFCIMACQQKASVITN